MCWYSLSFSLSLIKLAGKFSLREEGKQLRLTRPVRGVKPEASSQKRV